jgi:hypothetical protein
MLTCKQSYQALTANDDTMTPAHMYKEFQETFAHTLLKMDDKGEAHMYKEFQQTFAHTLLKMDDKGEDMLLKMDDKGEDMLLKMDDRGENMLLKLDDKGTDSPTRPSSMIMGFNSDILRTVE